MATYDMKLPDIGEGVAEGEIVRWMVKAGDTVEEEQPLVEVMTDKATVEIPSPRRGTVTALHAETGAMVPVGAVIISILPADGAGAAPRVGNAAQGAPAAEVRGAASPPLASSAKASTGRISATPAVRQLAKELGLDLSMLAGSGPAGAITTEDVRRASAGGAAGTHAGASRSAPATTAVPSSDEPEERIPLRGLRRRIAEHMRAALSTTAQFSFVAECDFTAVVEHRERTRARAEAAGIKLTYLAYVLRALIEPLRRFPLLNSSLDDAAHEIALKRYYHVGLATETDEGLTVPVLHHADRLGLFALAREIARLAAAARARRLDLAELRGGTFTVTSTGAQGGLLATPIVHHPQVAILGVHEVKKRPAVVNDAIVIRSLGNLSLSLDHRVVDGAVGAAFLYALIDRLERPEQWLTEGDLA